ncbi:MAG TPA: RsiV family protein [Oscillospiraceae bacterium]|nr:RsiV family protein [Oscillospiraceae bacterium]
MPQPFQAANIIEQSIQQAGITVAYPEVAGLSEQDMQAKINEQIIIVVRSMMLAQGITAVDLVQMEGTYTIELNEKGLLSIRFENYVRPDHRANGITLLRALTFNLDTGVHYSFNELFKPSLPYHYLINNLIQEQIKQKALPTTGTVSSVTARQDFYLMRTSVVIIFPELTFTPQVIGPPEFKLSFKQLRELVNPLGPLARLI